MALGRLGWLKSQNYMNPITTKKSEVENYLKLSRSKLLVKQAQSLIFIA
jgi:hypothetical protein